MAGLLSPQFHEYDAIEPSESADAEASAVTVSPLSAAVNDAVGRRLGPSTDTVFSVVPMSPWLSVTVSFTV